MSEAKKMTDDKALVSSAQLDLKQRIDYLWKIHDYLFSAIKFSDTKAAFVIAFVSEVIAVLVAHQCHRPLLSWRFGLFGGFDPTYTFTVWFSYAAFGLLAGSILLAILAIMPRLSRTPGAHQRVGSSPMRSLSGTPFKNLVYWKDILAFDSQESYRETILSMELEGHANALANHVYSLACICDKKFHFTNYSIRLGFVGIILASSLIINSKS